jgi:hypothetical protein
MATLSVVGFTAIFGNVIGIGLLLLLTACGPDGALPPIVVALIFSVLFISSVIAVLEATRASGPSALRVAAQLTGTLLRNPVVISPVLGIIYSMTALPLPRAVSNYLDLMAAGVGPAALFAVDPGGRLPEDAARMPTRPDHERFRVERGWGSTPVKSSQRSDSGRLWRQENSVEARDGRDRQRWWLR